MKKIRTLIIDDEPLAREGIRILLKPEESIEILAECFNGQTALENIERHQPDLIFLDVQMPQMTGFEMLEKLPAQSLPVVVFVTAYDEYAIRAFDAQAIDYLLKPYTDERFYQALNRAKSQLASRQARINNKHLRRLLTEYKNKQPSTAKKLTVKSGGRTLFIAPHEIDWIEATDYYVTLHAGSQKYLLRETMKEIESRLNQKEFIRIHRSSLVNVRKIQELRPHRFGNYLIVLESGVRLSLSRRRKEAVELILSSISNR